MRGAVAVAVAVPRQARWAISPDSAKRKSALIGCKKPRPGTLVPRPARNIWITPATASASGHQIAGRPILPIRPSTSRMIIAAITTVPMMPWAFHALSNAWWVMTSPLSSRSCDAVKAP